MTIQLKQLVQHPTAFRRAIAIDVDGERVMLRDVIDDWQAEDFSRLDGGWLRVSGRDQNANGKQKLWSERPRGHSKTSDLAVSVTWALFASLRRLKGIVAAADQDQARLLRDAIDQLLRLNPWLAQFVEVQRDRVCNSQTGSELLILASDVGSSYGLTPDFIVADEIVHWGKRDLWDSLLTAAGKRKHSVIVVITNAGFSESWQWETRELVRLDDEWEFSCLDGPHASWITHDRLEQQRRLLPTPVFERLWLNRWGKGSGDALTVDDIDASVTLTGPLDDGRGYLMFGGLDLSLTQDKSAFAAVGHHVGWTEYVTETAPQIPLHIEAGIDAGFFEWPEDEIRDVRHPGDGRTRLAHTRLWTPPSGGKIDFEVIEEHVLDFHKRFHLRSVLYDPYQAEYLAQRLQRRGVPMVAQPFTGNALPEMASQILEAFRSRTIDLYHDDQLIADLRRLRIEEKSYGFRLAADRTAAGHCDLATALVLAMLACRRNTPQHYSQRIDEPIVCMGGFEGDGQRFRICSSPETLGDAPSGFDPLAAGSFESQLNEWRR